VSKRSELALCAYTLAVVLFGFVQAMHNVYETDDIVPTTVTTSVASNVNLISLLQGELLTCKMTLQ
jgi:hypothetical protein